MTKVLFIDRDGTLIEEPIDYQVDNLDKIKFKPNVIPALLALRDAGYRFVMITNQDGLGTSAFPEAAFQICHDFILNIFNSQGIRFEKIFICPHTLNDDCLCRKPKTALVDEYLLEVDTANSWMIGDRQTDQAFAENIKVGYLPIADDHGWDAVMKALLQPNRNASLHRKTKETDITVSVNLDVSNQNDIQTPIGFFSHMLEQIACHAGFSLQLHASGDTEVDDHHLIEDTAIALGDAIRQALGDKIGINRYGFVLPMDDALASVAIDLSGRNFCAFEHNFTREYVGGLATEMVGHFFISFANSLGSNIHITVTGENHHHMVEACFKGLGRCLRQAIARSGQGLPSSKGVL